MQPFFKYFLLCCLFIHANSSAQNKAKKTMALSDKYQCIPCGHDCDKETIDHPGTCSSCNMPLVKVSSITFHTIQPSAICNYIKQHPDVVLLDVRTKAEYEGTANPDFGTLKNAVNIPIQELATRLPEIAKLKNKDIIVFCSHSHRSPQASYLLTQNGFSKVTNMAGGMSMLKDRSCMK
jgi:rhodanese-related sulfurtransferase